MKYLLFFFSAVFMISCGSQKATSGIAKAERQTYKMFIQEDGYLSQTPAMQHVELIPEKYGFTYVRTLEGPGVSLIDSIYFHPNGQPREHVMKHYGNTKRVVYSKPNIFMIELGDTARIINEYDTVYDALQLDLVLRGYDTLGITRDIPFFLPTSGDFTFYEIQEIREDSIPAHWLTREEIPVVHRFAAGSGTLYEAWYAEGEVLPVKMRVRSGGTQYVYLRYIVEEME
ncbi:hypothetical protein [Phaeocystidibacter luteus]|uniref:DUF3108 domain-containing protein n=1 Tax=Phaeocystidibacter luteus TaxID=911197 RepID=A0A6N6REF5_9FLAO|nr:hypothetical protein [Phaeocystidibacter luteus]KAB2808031.1 hypothetical protein F8C67_10695 [Phaeocystidibacter luteus]